MIFVIFVVFMFANENPCIAGIVAGILAVILSVITALYRTYKASSLTKKRLSYSFSELSNNYELWNQYVNPFLEPSKRFHQEEFNKTPEDEKINLLMNLD